MLHYIINIDLVEYIHIYIYIYIYWSHFCFCEHVLLGWSHFSYDWTWQSQSMDRHLADHGTTPIMALLACSLYKANCQNWHARSTRPMTTCQLACIPLYWPLWHPDHCSRPMATLPNAYLVKGLGIPKVSVSSYKANVAQSGTTQLPTWVKRSLASSGIALSMYFAIGRFSFWTFVSRRLLTECANLSSLPASAPGRIPNMNQRALFIGNPTCSACTTPHRSFV